MSFPNQRTPRAPNPEVSPCDEADWSVPPGDSSAAVKRTPGDVSCSPELLRLLFENASDAVLLIEDGTFSNCNRAALALLGIRSTGELGEQRLWHFSPPFQPDGTPSEAKAKALFAEALRNGSVRTEWLFQHPNGTLIPLEVVLTAIRVSGKNVLHSVWRDITERKKSEWELTRYRDQLQRLVEERTAELDLARQRVEAILNNSVDGIVLADINTGIVQSNHAFDTLFACAPDDYFGMPLVALAHPDDAGQLAEIIEDVIKHQAGRRLEVRALRKDGGIADTEFGIGFIKVGSAGGARLVCSIRDITERKDAEQALIQALEREKELGELKSRFVSMVSHEFRTPLATIQATTDTLRYYLPKLDAAQLNARFNKVQAQVQHMTMLLEDVLTFGWFQSDRVEFSPVSVNINELCRGVLEDVGSMITVHRIVYTSADENLMADADLKLLRQVITNLLTNALKYSPNGKCVRFDVSRSGSSVTFRVADSGIGIPAADQPHVFEAFFRASNVGNISGTGLGLAVAKRAVELHGGSLTLDSIVGAGTTFVATIPMSQFER